MPTSQPAITSSSTGTWHLQGEGKIPFICYLTLEDLKSKIGRNPDKTYLMNMFSWMTVLLAYSTDGQQPLGHSLALTERLMRSLVDTG